MQANGLEGINLSFEKEQFPHELLPGAVKYYVGKYREAAECPDEFLAMSALAVASALAGPHYTLNGGVSLNNYYLLVGRSALSRKTTSIGLAIDLMTYILVGMDHLVHRLEVEGEQARISRAYDFITAFSTEGLQERGLAIGGSTLARINEYRYVLDLNKRQSQGNTITDLTDLYDGKAISKRLAGRSFSVSGFALTMLAASTPEWIKDLGANHHVAGGFVNRHLCCVGESDRLVPIARKVPEAELTPVIESFRKLIPTDLKVEVVSGEVRWVSSASKEICLSDPAMKLWDAYYRDARTRLRQVESDRLTDIAAREETHALKLAGLRCALEGRLQIEPVDLAFGARLARWSTRNALDLLEPNRQFDLGQYNPTAKKIIKYLLSEAPQSKTEIAHRHGGKQSRVNITLDVMVREGLLKLEGDQYHFGASFQPQDSEIEEIFGKSMICEIAEKLELEMGVPRQPKVPSLPTKDGGETAAEREARLAWEAASGR